MTNNLTHAQIALMHYWLQLAIQYIGAPIGNGESSDELAPTVIDPGWLEDVSERLWASNSSNCKATRPGDPINPTPADFNVIGAMGKSVLVTDPIAGKPGDFEADDRNATTASQADVWEANSAQKHCQEVSKIAMALVLLSWDDGAPTEQSSTVMKCDDGATTEQSSTVMKWPPHPMRADAAQLSDCRIVIIRRKPPSRAGVRDRDAHAYRARARLRQTLMWMVPLYLLGLTSGPRLRPDPIAIRVKVA